MTSLINPNNINGAYPVAGQDNNSQGFRDNFTNTAQNFTYAADEITDLQNKAILKQALTGGTLNNNMLGSTLSNAVLSDMGYAFTALGTLTGTVPLDYATSQFYSVTAGSNISLSFSNWPASGIAGVLTVQVTTTSAYTLQLPAAVTINANGIQGLDTSTNIISFAAAGTYTFTFSTTNGGTTIAVNETNKQLQPFNASSANFTSGAINLGVTTTIFNGAAAATLAAGVVGQVVVLVQTVTPGTATITVTNPGWVGGGVITLNDQGETATLMYTDSGWFCIGSNGAAFS